MLISPAYAQAAAAAPSSGSMIFMQLVPLILIFVIFYFLLIRPQQKRVKEHRAMLEALRRGDTVVTGGGLIGKVYRVEDNEVQVELADNVRVRVVKGTITEVRAKGEAQPANDKK
jgi:preprotein translocase subunit YajC